MFRYNVAFMNCPELLRTFRGRKIIFILQTIISKNLNKFPPHNLTFGCYTIINQIMAGNRYFSRGGKIRHDNRGLS